MRFLVWFLALWISLPAVAANRLAQADSPYLRMHGENPVDWYPWGDEAFARAKAEDKPVFLSIGYSSCYWCQVAEETLYRNPAIAARMNAGFINVKVDREQRPDIDRLYMTAALLLGGGSGWPNNLFLTPDRKPFFAGTYFPPEDNDLGQAGFPTILQRIREIWEQQREKVSKVSDQVAEVMGRRPSSGVEGASDPDRWRKAAIEQLLARVDAKHGGLSGGRPAKFPQVPALDLLAKDPEGLRAVRRTLDVMAISSLRDHLGGGFHRYTVDPGWSQPHFEKMLYDNAQMLRLYATLGETPLQRQVARETGEFLLRSLQAPAGGFYASFDAVSAGREGAHYLWNETEIPDVLGAGAKQFLALYRIQPLSGNVHDPAEEADLDPDRGALRLREELPLAGLEEKVAKLATARAALLQRRGQRPAPARDEKIILAWNGLAIEALAVAGSRLREPGFIDAARRAAERLWQDTWEPERHHLRQALFQERPQGEGFLEDYAFFGLGLLALADATGDALWHKRALALAKAMLKHFGRPDGGLTDTLLGAELFAALPETGDGPYPAGASAAYRLLSQLETAGEEGIGNAAARLLGAQAPLIGRAPSAWPSLLAAMPEKVSLPQGSAGVVGFTSAWQTENTKERFALTLTIAPGWHLNANPPSLDYLIPTRLSFQGAKPQGLRYPKATAFQPAFAAAPIEVYEGKVIIEAEFETGQRPTAARLEVQACSGEVCLPPATVPVALIE